MRHILSFLAALAILAAPSAALTVKVLAYYTNGQVFYSGTNTLTFTNALNFSNAATTRANLGFSTNILSFWTATNASNARTGLGFSTNLSDFWTSTNASNARSAVGLGATWLTNTNVTNFRTAIGLGINDTVTLAYGDEAYIGQDGGALYVDNFYPDYIQCGQFGIGFGTTNSAALTRANLGIPLSALTNTSNVTAMRALSGSTNTNAPYSGSVSLTNTNTLVFSNGILQSVQ